MLLVPTGTCHEFYPRGTVPIVETGPLCARRGCPRPDWRDGLCHACWRLAVLFKKDPGMFAYKPLHDYGDELDAVEFPWEEWEREASFRGLNLPDVIARTRGEEEPPKERRPAEEPWEEPWPPEERWPDEEQWPDT